MLDIISTLWYSITIKLNIEFLKGGYIYEN